MGTVDPAVQDSCLDPIPLEHWRGELDPGVIGASCLDPFPLICFFFSSYLPDWWMNNEFTNLQSLYLEFCIYFWHYRLFMDLSGREVFGDPRLGICWNFFSFICLYFSLNGLYEWFPVHYSAIPPGVSALFCREFLLISDSHMGCWLCPYIEGSPLFLLFQISLVWVRKRNILGLDLHHIIEIAIL